jgi:hypothetical protein
VRAIGGVEEPDELIHSLKLDHQYQTSQGITGLRWNSLGERHT